MRLAPIQFHLAALQKKYQHPGIAVSRVGLWKRPVRYRKSVWIDLFSAHCPFNGTVAVEKGSSSERNVGFKVTVSGVGYSRSRTLSHSIACDYGTMTCCAQFQQKLEVWYTKENGTVVDIKPSNSFRCNKIEIT